jgi:Phosphotransferase enzyme family
MEAVEWAREHGARGEVEPISDFAWARVSRIGDLWLKECRPVQAYEVPLTVALASRWPDRLPPVVAADPERGRLLLGDAGSPIASFGDALEAWLVALPLYAELQQRETARTDDHLAAGVPDLRAHTLPARYAAWTEREPRLAPFAGRFVELCASLTRPPTVQHDDLHESNVYARDGKLVFLDWGDTCIAHPFATMLITLRYVAYFHDESWLPHLRAAYLEPWGSGLVEELDAALQVAAFARLLQWERIGDTEPLERNLRMFVETVVAA